MRCSGTYFRCTVVTVILQVTECVAYLARDMHL